ncbi:hypothetical protein E0Z10_g7443 [Xylaria hypoxylon]|uniref:Uncharacterized protein n=1 Tax=Xylaria hypoxylon TaxID=37992 RepID=A0A4Z0YBK7_9PEZI|nr:hypothetical protein E0Z10_g7443 [Xylaria hypoxylon]
MGAPEMNPYEVDKAQRAARKRLRTSWRTDATENEKETALRLAINKIGGGKKYSWLQQGPKTVADTLGQKRAIELGIKTGILAKELKVGEHRESDGPQSLAINWQELRSAGINMSREEFEKSLRDAGVPKEDIRAAITPVPEKIVGRSAASARAKSSSPVLPSVEETAPKTTTSTTPTKPTTSTTLRGGRGKKRAISIDEERENSNPAKKRKGKKQATVPSARELATPPMSSSPQAPSPRPSNIVDFVSTDDVPSFAPRSPSISELEALLDEDDVLSFAPRSPSISELEALLDADDVPSFAPRSPSISELEALLDAEE